MILPQLGLTPGQPLTNSVGGTGIVWLGEDKLGVPGPDFAVSPNVSKSIKVQSNVAFGKKSLGLEMSTISHTGLGTLRNSHQLLPALWHLAGAPQDLAEIEELAANVGSLKKLDGLLDSASFLQVPQQAQLSQG